MADTLAQSTWGTAGASRSFGDTIAARGTHATALADGKAAAWISTMGGSSRLSSDGGHAGADYTLTGAAFGMETCLSEKSIALGSMPVEIPDFTGGRWIKRPARPGDIFSLDAVYPEAFE